MAYLHADAIALNETSTSPAEPHVGSGIVAKLLVSMGEIYCGLHGHQMLMQFERTRVFLQCASCGHESPGWALTEAPPKVSVRGDARRHALNPPRAMRRIA